MLTPNQISSHKFFQTKQGYYKADDVDDYMSQVFQTVYELYENNKKIQARLNGLTKDLESYYKDKDSIAAAIIGAQSFANEKIQAAEEKAAEILAKAEKDASALSDEKQEEADKYYKEAKEEADKLLSKAESALSLSMEKATKNAEEYIAKINIQASEIITNANEQASKIVSRSFSDAKKARDKYDEIISEANLSLPTIGQDISSLKINLSEKLNKILNILSSIEVPNEISIETTSIDEENFVFQPVEIPETLKVSDALKNNAELEAEELIEPHEDNTEETIKVEETIDEDVTDIFSNSDEVDSIIKQKFNFDDLFYDISDFSEE